MLRRFKEKCESKFKKKILSNPKVIKNAEYVVYYNTVHNRIRYPYKSYEAVDYLIKNYDFESILDVGSGGGEQASVFARNGKKVTTLDYGKSYAYEKYNPEVNIISIVADINSYEFNRKYDAVFCSHVLEHQLNVEVFLEKIISAVDEGGIICITVPPYKSEIVSGHVSLWNAGLLLYRLVLAGCDCSDAHVKYYDYDISVIIRKKTIDVKSLLRFDKGDLKTLRQYFPSGVNMKDFGKRDVSFEGNIKEINW